MNTELYKDIDKFIEENYDEIFKNIGRLIAVDSVRTEPKPGMPFGEGCDKAKNVAMEICKELGLETRDCEGMLCYASVGGDGDKYLATITHLDVVPVGEGWTSDPFEMVDKEGYIIGRGVLDDKGPSMLCLYALKYLKDRGVELKYPVRALLGLAEETGMEDVEHYLKNYPAPLFCFSPDANFPLCNGEKGIYHGRMVSKLPLGNNIVNIKGGVATNVIPSKCEAWVKASELKSTDKVDAVMEAGVWHLTAHGIGGHASLPEGTENAIGVMANYILENNIADENEKRFLSIVSKLNESWKGEGVGCAAPADGKFDYLTIVGGVIGIEDGRFFQSLDSRYPTTTSAERIVAAIEAVDPGAVSISIDTNEPPFYMELDNPGVQACLSSYNEVTGENAQPYTIGGGTYARQFPNAVSFGPEHPEREQPAFVGPMHGADEGANKAWLIEALKVYILTLLKLEQIDF